MEKQVRIDSFSPTESLMILHPSYPYYGDFIKYSIVELINLKVLDVYRDFAGLKEFPNLKYWYVKRGESFNTIKTEPYHDIFIERFRERDKRIPIQIYGKQIFSSTNWDHFKDELVYRSLINKGIFTDTLFRHLNIYILSNLGSEIKRTLKAEIKKLDKAIVKQKQESILKSCEILGLNIFLSDKINSKILKEISAAIKSIPSQSSYSDSVFYTNYDFGGFSSFETSYDSFDFGGGEFGGGGAGGDFDSSSSWD